MILDVNYKKKQINLYQMFNKKIQSKQAISSALIFAVISRDAVAKDMMEQAEAEERYDYDW